MPAQLLPPSYDAMPVATLWLNFGGDETLIAVIAVRRASSAATISAAFRAITAALAREAGAAATQDRDTVAHCDKRGRRKGLSISRYDQSREFTEVRDHNESERGLSTRRHRPGKGRRTVLGWS